MDTADWLLVCCLVFSVGIVVGGLLRAGDVRRSYLRALAENSVEREMMERSLHAVQSERDHYRQLLEDLPPVGQADVDAAIARVSFDPEGGFAICKR